MSSNKNSSTEEKTTEPDDSFISQKSNENSNGLPVNEELCFPEEVLAEMFLHFDNKTLLSCHLVCKQWDVLIKDYVWRKKAEYVTRQEWPVDKEIPWTYYYYLCDNRPFGKNLTNYKEAVLNENPYVTIFEFQKGDDIPVSIIPFPNDDTFQGTCVITSERTYDNHFAIDLLKEGFTEHILDKLQPIVTVTEWYALYKDFRNPNYICEHKLIASDSSLLKKFLFLANVVQVETWIKFTKSFEDYGEGLRKIICHHRKCRSVVMVGYSVTLEIPKRTPTI